MLKILLLLFLTIPVIEIYLLIKVGGVIGAIPTILLIIATAVVGAYLLRMQGINTLARVQKTMAAGEIPALEVMEGLVLLVSGALLVTPGFFTDTLGFIMLVPGIRRSVIMWALSRSNIIQVRGQHYHNQPHPFDPHEHQPGHPDQPKRPHKPTVLEGEFRRED